VSPFAPSCAFARLRAPPLGTGEAMDPKRRRRWIQGSKASGGDGFPRFPGFSGNFPEFPENLHDFRDFQDNPRTRGSPGHPGGPKLSPGFLPQGVRFFRFLIFFRRARFCEKKWRQKLLKGCNHQRRRTPKSTKSWIFVATNGN
jgi:hypothetical protein